MNTIWIVVCRFHAVQCSCFYENKMYNGSTTVHRISLNNIQWGNHCTCFEMGVDLSVNKKKRVACLACLAKRCQTKKQNLSHECVRTRFLSLILLSTNNQQLPSISEHILWFPHRTLFSEILPLTYCCGCPIVHCASLVAPDIQNFEISSDLMLPYG